MAQQSKRYSEAKKRALLKRHIVDGVAISELCNETKLNPTVAV